MIEARLRATICAEAHDADVGNWIAEFVMLADRIPHHSTLGRVLRWPLRFVHGDTPRRIVSGAAAGLLWYPMAGPHAIWLGHYERRVLRAFDRELRRCITRLNTANVIGARRVDSGGLKGTAEKPGDPIASACTVWDVGAHAGLFSLIAARAGAHVLAFEPLAANVQAIRRHLDCNALADNVSLHPFALGARNGSAGFESDSTGMEGRVANAGTTAVEVRRADDLDVSAPDLIKLDVEGAELDVLAGATRTIRTTRPVIFLEIHAPIRIDDCLELLPEYRAVRLDGPRFLCSPSEHSV